MLLFYLKSSFCSQDIYVFALIFLVIYKNNLIRKIRLISKFMTSQPAINILLNISRSKGNHTMKPGQVIEYNMRNILLKNYTQNVVEKLFPDIFLNSQNGVYLQINSLKFYTVCLYCMLICGLSKYSERQLTTKLQTTSNMCTVNIC